MKEISEFKKAVLSQLFGDNVNEADLDHFTTDAQPPPLDDNDLADIVLDFAKDDQNDIILSET